MKTRNLRISAASAALLLMTAAPAIAADATVDFSTCSKPEYPRASLVNEEQGTVTLAFLVAPDGAVAESKIEKSSGFKNLDKAAQKALSACKFKTKSKEATWTKMDYVWKLE
ncbi:MAG TPA: energy transducer TonB [Paucimonas sp.]|nr:energy transducer TonB [Paucimonas sp.]